MANTPTRRPPSYPDRRRPSRGRRHVARPFRDRIKTAADLLEQAGHEEAAQDVRAVLAPGGWSLLRLPSSGSSSNLPLSMSVALKAALAAAGEEFGVSLSAVAQDGFRAVVDGRWVPPRTLMKVPRRPKSDTKTNLNVRIPDDLLKQVDEVIPRLTKDLGYRVTRSSIAISWLAEELGVDRPTRSDTGVLKVVADKRLVDHWVRESEARKVDLQEVVPSGVRGVLDGTYVPQAPEWNAVSQRPRGGGRWQVPEGQAPKAPVEKAKLSFLLDQELLDDLREWCADRTEESELPFYPGTFAIALLKDRLGEPAK